MKFVILALSMLAASLSFASIESKGGKESIEVLTTKDKNHIAFQYCVTAKNGEKQCQKLGSHESYSRHELNDVVSRVSRDYKADMQKLQVGLFTLFGAFGSGVSIGAYLVAPDAANTVVSTTSAVSLMLAYVSDSVVTNWANRRLYAYAALMETDKKEYSSGLIKSIAKKLDAALQ